MLKKTRVNTINLSLEPTFNEDITQAADVTEHGGRGLSICQFNFKMDVNFFSNSLIIKELHLEAEGTQIRLEGNNCCWFFLMILTKMENNKQN